MGFFNIVDFISFLPMTDMIPLLILARLLPGSSKELMNIHKFGQNILKKGKKSSKIGHHQKNLKSSSG